MFVAFAKKTKKNLFLESNRRILYLAYLRSSDIIFMKFDRIDLKIWAFKVGKNSFFEL